MAPPAPGTPPPTETWKVRVRGRATVGPFPTDLIVLGIERGKVPIESEICREGTTIWRPLASVPAFYRAMGLHRVPLLPPPVATSASDDDEVTRIAPSPAAAADDDDDDEKTRVLEALLPESTSQRRPPSSAAGPGPWPPAAAAWKPGRAAAPGPAAGAPPPPLRATAPGGPVAGAPPPPLSAAGSSLGRAEDDAPTEILDQPRAFTAGRAQRHAAPPPPLGPPGSPNEPRTPVALPACQPTPSPFQRPLPPPPLASPAEPITAANLMDADDDENDVRGVHQGLSGPPGAIRPAAGAPPERTTARPAPRRSARPPVVNERPLRALPPERADELTAPARRLRRDRQRMLIALAVLAVGLIATLALLLVLLLRR